MKRIQPQTLHARRALQILVWFAALTLTACDSSVNFSPTAPRWPDINGPVAERSLLITGTLTSDVGGCLEATVLYDGFELPGARTVCADPNGCAELRLEATAFSETGHHTVSFQVLEQAAAEVEYLAQGQVLVTRDGLNLGGVRMGLGPERATLRRGDSITFDIEFRD